MLAFASNWSESADNVGGAGADAAAGTAASVLPSGSEGSCRERALAASPGRPINSYDFASNSQSAGVPPPLARRVCSAATALSMEPAADLGAGAARLSETLTAFVNALAATGDAGRPARSDRPSHAYRPRAATTIRPAAAADACRG